MYLSREFRLLLYFALGLMLGAFVTVANAGYALPSPPPGVTSQAGSLMYRVPAAVTAVNGVYTPGVAVNVAGKAVTVPAAMRFAANAGTFAVNAVRLNPYLAVGAVAIWLASEGLEWDSQSQQFVVATPPGYLWSQQSCPYSDGCGLPLFTSPEDAGSHACTTYYGSSMSNFYQVNATSYAYQCAGGGGSQSKLVGTQEGGTSAASESEWQQLALSPLPDSAADAISREFPLPIQHPELQPVTVPLSEPYLDPVTGQPYRDMVRVSPAPTPESPFRVRTDPYKEPVSSLDPDALPVTPTPEAPVEAIDPKEEPTPFCEQFPDASACAELGNTTDAPDVPTQTEQVGIAPVNVAPSGGTCPADKTVSTQFGDFAVSWGLLCQYAQAIRPIVLAMAWLSAGFGFFFGARRSS